MSKFDENYKSIHMFMCIYTYVYGYIYMYICMYEYISVYVYMYRFICLYMDEYISEYVYMCVYLFISVSYFQVIYLHPNTEIKSIYRNREIASVQKN